MPKERRDAQRSREAIKRAYVDLVINHHTAKITVASILEAANVSRGTFYAHFTDIYDVRSQVEDDLLASCKDALRQTDIQDVVADPYPQVLVVARFFASHAEAIARLADTPNRAFVAKFTDILLEGVRQSEHTIQDPEVNAIMDACAVGACVEGCFEMVRRGCRRAPERVARDISDFIARGMRRQAR